jgi:hypothetical protein
LASRRGSGRCAWSSRRSGSGRRTASLRLHYAADSDTDQPDSEKHLILITFPGPAARYKEAEECLTVLGEHQFRLPLPVCTESPKSLSTRGRRRFCHADRRRFCHADFSFQQVSEVGQALSPGAFACHVFNFAIGWRNPRPTSVAIPTCRLSAAGRLGRPPMPGRPAIS